jgi:hypothetical protein
MRRKKRPPFLDEFVRHPERDPFGLGRRVVACEGKVVGSAGTLVEPRSDLVSLERDLVDPKSDVVGDESAFVRLDGPL